MRTPVLVTVLLAAAAVLAWLVFSDAPPREPTIDLAAGEASPAPLRPGRTLLPVEAPASTAEVVGAERWEADLDEEAAPLLQADPRIGRLKEVRGADGEEEWTPTGARVLEILARELGPRVPIRFRDEAALADFEARTWPQPFPAVFPLVMLLESCREVGFRAAPRPEAIYLVRVD